MSIYNPPPIYSLLTASEAANFLTRSETGSFGSGGEVDTSNLLTQLEVEGFATQDDTLNLIARDETGAFANSQYVFDAFANTSGNVIYQFTGSAIDWQNGNIQWTNITGDLAISSITGFENGKDYSLLVTNSGLSDLQPIPVVQLPTDVGMQATFGVYTTPCLMSISYVNDVGFVTSNVEGLSPTSFENIANPLFHSISASTTFTGGASNLFDNSLDTYWIASNATSNVLIDFGVSNEKRPNQYMFSTVKQADATSENGGRPPSEWVFEASNDNLTWTVLHAQISANTIFEATYVFRLYPKIAYRYFRFRGIALNELNPPSNNYLGLSRLGLSY